MAQQKRGWVTRLLEGKEKSEEYARSTLPTNRWQLFWDIFKGNFGKIVKVNILVFFFFVPFLFVFLFHGMLNDYNSCPFPFCPQQRHHHFAWYYVDVYDCGGRACGRYVRYP